VSKTRLGLDLKGGASVVLEATNIKDVTSSKMDQTVSVIRNRVDRLGVAEPEIQRLGTNQISVQLPGATSELLKDIGRTAVLGFWDIKQFGTGYSSQADALKAAGVTTTGKLPSGKTLIHWTVAGGNSSDQWYIATGAPALTGAEVSGASVTYGTNSQPIVSMSFTKQGGDTFAALTKKMAESYQITGDTQRLAIVLDGEVQSSPSVKEAITGGSAVIEGSFTYTEANDLAVVIQTGALPLELTTVSSTDIGASLGQAALEQALLAGAIGLALIIVFMIAYYRLLGVIAGVALGIYGVLFIGILNGIGVTMTLPGIAGMILTLGMAVDANVLIFARMRDEVAAGKTIAAATNAGFRKAFRAVFDCNMTTILTAAILFWAASGGIKGFALTLGVGVALSMFTAVVVTRSMLSLLSGWSVFRHPKALGLHVPKARKVSVDEGGQA
jgi:preprotein translocase subunit SecD